MRTLIHRVALTLALTPLFTSAPAQVRDAAPDSVMVNQAAVNRPDF
jgi:hypothetical protein